MPFQLKTFLLSIFLSLGLIFPALAALAPGAKAPDFTGTDTKGNSFELSALAGKHVVLEWTNHDCPFVKKHYDGGHMQALQKQAADDGVVWVSVISSAPGKQGHVTDDEANDIAAQKKAVPAHIIRDESGAIGHLYGAKTTPHMYVIDEEGNIAYMGAIDSINSTSSADVDQATNYVTAALSSLKKGEEVAVKQSAPYGCSVKYKAQ